MGSSAPSAPDLLDRLPLGVSVYRLDDPADARSLRLVYANAASGAAIGLDPTREVGRRLVEVLPDIGETDALERYAEVARTGRPANLGLVTYGDDRVPERTFQVEAVPLPDHQVGVVFEDVSSRAELRALRAARGDLAREEARYRSLIEATAAIVWVTAPDGTFVEDQPQWRAVTGQTTAELTGAGWIDAVHPDDRAETLAAWEAAVAAGTPYQVEHRLRLADGGYRWMAARAAPVRGAGGAVVEWVGIHADIEAERAAAEELAASESRFQTLFDAISDVVLVYPLGPDGPEPFVAFNQAAVDLYGYAADELRAMTPADLVDPRRVDLRAALVELRRTRRSTFESVHLTKDGRRLPMSTSAQLAEFDGRLCVIALCRDDTERRQFRRELSRANLGLERAVAERTARAEAFAEDLKILHRITTVEHDSPQARYEAYLRAGCEMFDLPVGILSATPIDEATDEQLYRIEAVVSPDSELEPGVTVPLREAFCDAVIESGETVVYADAQEEAPDHPACAGRGLRAFIGTPLRVDGEVVGTLNFVSPEPREGGFSAAERDLVEVMADAVARRLSLDRAEAAETAARERYRSIVDTVEAGVVVVDAQARVVVSNPSARAFLGLSDDGEDRPARWPVVDEGGAAIADDDLPERTVLRTGEPVRGRVQGITPPGQPTRWYRVNATPIDEDHDGRPDAVVVSFLDVTDYREALLDARRSQGLLRSVLIASPDGVMAFRSVRDDGGHIVDFEWTLANPRASEIVGRDVADLVGRRLLDVLPGNRDAGLFDAYVGVVETGARYETVVPYAHDGLDASFRLVAVPLPTDDGFTVTFADVVEGHVVDEAPGVALDVFDVSGPRPDRAGGVA
ncbi:PAS domain-containing protein [Rubrivirga sp. S365]|uniref:histidine kinase n=1 Tax=Rubrivirga litoralis TaxID=3075598 RepID=A0ABU3BV13_9BACT|nr:MULTISPECIES: PAS domain S-box protein [unclassified Rubrivirga]MDT0633135.1 PAS domain-containing protein [Rubrivirga sp. F394]MDT7857510.1 PAS domain-containing protein [Rubrivirga sp. S365]